jgi:pimeloyl-ACP methyl ester carboxylesterase
MNAVDPVRRFLGASTEERLQLVLDGAHEDELKAYFGSASYEELRALASRTMVHVLDVQNLSRKTPKNLVLVPGVMGSELSSRSLGGVWWIDPRTVSHLNDLRLGLDGKEDADPNHEVFPFTTDPEYEPFRAAVLRRDDFGHEAFAYDWRKPLAESTSSLRDLVLGMHAGNGGLPVHLVGHSMGGLMIRATLHRHGDELWPILGRILFIATPHYGSPAIGSYLKHHFWGLNLLTVLGRFLSRATFRSLWGVLGLLPAPSGTYPGTRPNDPQPWVSKDSYNHPCANFDMYAAEGWELGLDPQETGALQQILDAAAELHRTLYQSHVALSQERRDRMAVIAGVGYKTIFRTEYGSRFLGRGRKMKHVTKRVEGDPHREGDGRVPLASAALENVPVRYVRAKHGGMANVPAVYEAALRFLKGEDMGLPTTPGGALSVDLGPLDTDSEAPHLDGSGTVESTSDDPGFLNPKPPDEATLAALLNELDRGGLPEFRSVRLL